MAPIFNLECNTATLPSAGVTGESFIATNPKTSFTEKLILCGEHGPGLFCHVNSDGEHVDVTYCTCARNSDLCPIDVHRHQAAKVRSRTATLIPQLENKSARRSRLGSSCSYPVFPDPEIGADGEMRYFDAEDYGAPSDQLIKARLMHKLGLKLKAKRQAYCGLFGKVYKCENGCPDGYRAFGCENRYCLNCARRIFDSLFAEYRKLEPVAKRLVPHWPIRPGCGIPMHHVMAKLDIMPLNTGLMPSAKEVRQFNKDVRCCVPSPRR